MAIATRIEKAYGANLTGNPASWVWTDISNYPLGSVTVTAGRPDEAGTTTPTRCTFRLRNTDGRFSPRLPSSPYYPNIRRQTPVRVSLNPGTGFVQVFQGYVDDIVPSWPSGNSDYAEVAVTASGLLRRLQQGNNVLRSALYRAITTSSVQPSAYWPCEDGPNVSQAMSPIAGVAPMKTIQSHKFAATTGAPGSDQQPDFTAGGQLSGYAPPSGAVTQWRIQCVVKCNATPAGQFAIPLEWFTSDGTAWELVAHPLADGGMAFSDSTTLHNFSSNKVVDDGVWHEWRCTATQSGGNIVLNAFLDGALVINQTFAGTLTPIVQVVSNDVTNPSNIMAGVGHFVVWNNAISTPGLDTVDSMLGHAGETAGARIVRLCGEQGVPVSVSSTTGTTPMGPQGIGTLLSLLRECETADLGILYDGQSAGLNYLARQDRYNLPVSMALDTKRQQVKLPFSPTEDDQRIRNDWTVTRPGGTFAHAFDSAHIAANGLYDTSDTRNVQTDSQLPNLAAWLVHLGTVDEMRVPGLPLQLIDRPELWALWFATMLGERVTAANLPAQYPPGILDMIVEGYTETWNAVSWKVDLNTSPYQPWSVYALDTNFPLELDGQTLASSLVPGATTLSLATSAGKPLFTTAAGDFPVDLNVGGWVIHATAASGAASPQTLTIDAAPNTATVLSGTTVTLWRSPVLAL